jgi:hypothetical protein
MSYQPLILVGAARSGTKLLRDLVASHPEVDKVPFDINYIWRLANERLPHDELWPDLLSPKTRGRIVRNVGAFHSGAPFLIEKTVSNCLRIPFVQAVFPRALFIHLVRDGRDVVESVYRQWLAPPNWGYIFRKALTFPLTEATGYAKSYALTTLRKLLFHNKGNVSTWGPRYKGITEDLAARDLLEVCAIQWVRSIDKAKKDLGELHTSMVTNLRYEDFVDSPLLNLRRIAEMMKIDPAPYEELDFGQVSRLNVGKGFRSLSQDQQLLVLPHIQDTLVCLGYC